MSCNEREAALNDYVDGHLSETLSAELERHLATCRDCRQTADELSRLVRDASRLGDIPPARDLLDGIRAPRRSVVRRPWMALAAGVLVVVLAGVAGWRWWPSSEENLDTAALGELVEAYRNAEQQYLDASQRLLDALESQQATLSPDALAAFEDSLRVIDAAIADVHDTVQSERPDLTQVQLLTALYHKKLQVLWKASRLSS